MTKKVLIVDAYTPAHIGNGVLLISSLEVLRKAFPGAEIRFLSLEMTTPSLVTDLHYDEFLFRFPVNLRIHRKLLWLVLNCFFCLIQWVNAKWIRVDPFKLAFARYRRRALEAIVEADIVVSITGEAINDRTRAVLPFFLFTYWLAAAWNKSVVIFPQSIGPLNRKWTRSMTRGVLQKCSMVVGRDKVSIRELQDLRIPEEIVVFSPDVGVVQPSCSREHAERILTEQGIEIGDRELVGVSVSSPMEDGISEVGHIQVMAEALNEAFAGRNVVLLIMAPNMPLEGVDKGDHEDCIEFRSRIEGLEAYVLSPRIYSPAEYKGILSLLSMFITSRMHVSILSTMAGTPTITLNTQRKLYGYMKNIGQENYSIDLSEETRRILVEKIWEIESCDNRVRSELDLARVRMSARIDQFAHQLRERLG